MGGNGSYSEEFGGVETKDRTHYDTEYRIDGHKIVVLQENPSHDKNNHLPISDKYKPLIKKIVDFNKKGKIWKQGKESRTEK